MNGCIKEILQGKKMRKLILTIVILLLTKAIYADGIIPNLQQYLTRYPSRIDAEGWVTIPKGELIDNKIVFDTNSQYQLVAGGRIFADATQVEAYRLTFKWCKPGYLTRIHCGDKLKIDYVEDTAGTEDGKQAKPTHELSYIKQRSPESIRYANEKRFKASLKNSKIVELIARNHNDLGTQITKLTEAVITINERMDKYQKKADKSRCDNCIIL